MKETSQQLIQDRIRELRENTDFVTTLLDRVVEYAIIAADFDGNIIAFNEGARQIYGYAPEGVIGKQRIEIFFPKDFVEAGKLQAIINDLIEQGSFSYEGEKVRKNGERFPAQILFTLTTDKSGKVVGFVEIVEDLTEHTQLEREKEEKAQALARAEQLERELHSLERLSASKTATTAQMLGLMPLRQIIPKLFSKMLQRYGGLMELALEQQAYRVEHDISESLRSIAEELGDLKAGPRDVVELHSSALKRKTAATSHAKAQAYVEEGRLMMLELMGYLVSYYRTYSLGSTGVKINDEPINKVVKR